MRRESHRFEGAARDEAFVCSDGYVFAFFLLRAFFSGIFEYTGKSGAGKGDSEIRKQNFLKMEEVDLREFRLGIEGEDGFLRFLFDRMRRFSTGIFMDEGFSARGKDSFL